MNKDISFVIDNIKFSVRSGVILKYNDMVLTEFSNQDEHSIIPGGRVKVGEQTNLTIKRELKEELGLEIDIQKLEFKKVIENFFEYKLEQVHELYFVYEYTLSEEEFLKISKIKYNKDDGKTFFKFIKKCDLININLMPKILLNIISD